MEIPTKVAYRIETRRAAGRGKNGRFATRHDLPAVVVLDSGPDHAQRLAERVTKAITARPGAAGIDRVVVERVGTVDE
jgi:hypothetical protein